MWFAVVMVMMMMMRELEESEDNICFDSGSGRGERKKEEVGVPTLPFFAGCRWGGTALL